MNFVSDNAGPAHPKVMEAVIRANEGAAMPYGNDPLTEAAVAGRPRPLRGARGRGRLRRHRNHGQLAGAGLPRAAL
jgi:hypothetical protein